MQIWNSEVGNYLESGLNTIIVLLQTLVALAAVCALVYVFFRIILPRFQFGANSNQMIRVVERVGIDTKRSLIVVEVAGKWLLVGVSESGVQLVSELEGAQAMAAEAQILLDREAQFKKIEDFRAGFAAKVANLAGRKEIKKDVKDQPEKKQFDWTLKK